MELKDIKAGDKVIYYYYHGKNFSKSRRIEIVEKVTPSGFIKVCGQFFYADGRVRGKGYESIIPCTPELENEIIQGQCIGKAYHLIKKQMFLLSYEAAKIINEQFFIDDNKVLRSISEKNENENT